MANNKRKDSKGYILNTGESQRAGDGRYVFTYTNKITKKRKCVYAKTLVELRKKEREIMRDEVDGIDPSKADEITLDQMYDDYIKKQHHLKETTKINYIYYYNHLVRGTWLGKTKIAKIKYSDVKEFYYSLMKEKGVKAASIENIHTQIHPALKMAVKDGYLRSNPSDDVMGELKKSKLWVKKKRHALTEEEQKAFMKYLREHKEYAGWLPIITFLLGTGCRIGEALGLIWDDVDMDKGIIRIRRTLVYRPDKNGESLYWINTPKTEAGERTIPLLDEVKDALLLEYQYQSALGFCEDEIDGVSGFVFSSGEGTVYIPSCINDAIHRITDDYNKEETERAKLENRPPVLIRKFSAHSLRHTFCTNLCKNTSDLKFIQTVMGHSDFRTSYEIYCECSEERKIDVMGSLQGKIMI